LLINKCNVNVCSIYYSTPESHISLLLSKDREIFKACRYVYWQIVDVTSAHPYPETITMCPAANYSKHSTLLVVCVQSSKVNGAAVSTASQMPKMFSI